MRIRKQKTQLRYIVKFGLFACFIILITVFLSCKEDYSFKNTAIDGTPFDPNIPVEVGTIYPDSGGYKTPFVIKGNNFGTDISKIKVVFNGDRIAPLVRSNGSLIYGIMPKQEDGHNTVSVQIEGEEVVESPTKFRYVKIEQVSTLAGKGGTKGYVDGTLVESRFAYMIGINMVTGNNLIVCEIKDDKGAQKRVRMISQDENKVVTLMSGYGMCHPAVTKDRTKAYSIEYTKPHTVFVFDQSNAWAGKRLLASLIDKDGNAITGDIYSCALDDEEKFLYFRDHSGKFGRIEIAHPANVEILNANCGTADKNISYLAWSTMDQCFYLSVQNSQGIYKVSRDGQTVERYAGFNGIGSEDGPRLNASFKNPAGMAFDTDGNIYLADAGGMTLRRINRFDGLVTTVAGNYGKNTNLDGPPLEATLNYPYAICVDDGGSFYIAEGWGYSVRKYAIE